MISKFSRSSKFILAVVGLTLVVILCGGSGDCSDPCDLERSKQDRFPGYWVACVDNKPVLMTYYKDFAVPIGSPGGLNPSDWDCSHQNSPHYKGSGVAPYSSYPLSGPLVAPLDPNSVPQPGKPNHRGTDAPGGQNAGDTRAAGSGLIAYLPPLFRDLPFLPSASPPPTACDPSFPDVFQTIHPNSQVTRISTCPFQVKARIPVVSRPLQIAITPDGSTALVTSFDNAVNFIDVTTNKVVFTLQTPSEVRPHGIAITADGTKAYITSFNPFNPIVQVIDLASRTLTTSFRTGFSYPQGATLSPDNSQLWITGPLDGVAEVYDTVSNTLIARVNAGFTTDVAFNSTGTRAYVTSSASIPGKVVVVDTATFLVLKSYTVGNDPSDISMSYGDQFLVVNNDGDGSVSVIDLLTDKVSTRKLGSAISGISFVQ